ncbi:MAG: hypothetical protein HXY44_03130 [Syntrophaceae bacterium]|nr:hypothetical protein [Syntrophaceae bacterium]
MKTILYIDHSASWRFLLQEELSEEGFEVVTASNLEEAVSTWGRIHPDLVIFEPRQNRLREEQFERLRNKYPNILWIGYSTSLQCPEEFKKWVHFYLPKSLQTEEMKSLIKSL